MPLTAAGLVLLSALLHVAWNALAKRSTDPVLFMALKGTVLVGVGVLLVAAVGPSTVPAGAWPFVIASGLIHTGYVISLGRAYDAGDISFVYPIARSAPAFVPVLAWALLGERVSPLGAAGVALVVCGVMLLQLRDSGHAGQQILRSLSSPEGRWAIATLSCVVAYSLVDKAGMERMSAVAAVHPALPGPLYFVLENILCYAVYLAFLVRQRPAGVLAFCRAEWPMAVVAGLCTLASYSLILHVFQTEPVSYVVALRQCSVLLAVLVGWLWLREPQGLHRFLYGAAISLGLGLVVIWG